MEYYACVQLAHAPDFLYRKLIEAVVNRIHGAIAAQGQGKVGISFPEYHKDAQGSFSRLGNRIQLVSRNQARLKGVINAIYLDDVVSDEELSLVSVSEIRPVPAESPRAIFKRNRSDERNMRRNRFPGVNEKIDGTYPFVVMNRGSTKRKKFHLRVEKVDSKKPFEQDATYSSYGLSSQYTLPIINE